MKKKKATKEENIFEKIANMKAGREMDAEIAEKIFNKRVIIHDNVKGQEPLYYISGQLSEFIGNMQFDELPKYSTDLNSAWLIVEHYGKSGAKIIVSLIPEDTLHPYHIVMDSGSSKQDNLDYWITSDNVTRGICTLALAVNIGRKKTFAEISEETK